MLSTSKPTDPVKPKGHESCPPHWNCRVAVDRMPRLIFSKESA